MRLGVAGCRGAFGLGDQFQPGQVAHRGQDMSGVRALGGALADETGLLQTREREVEETVGSAVLDETVAEVGQHAVVEAGIVQFHGQRVFEIDAAANLFGRLPVRQTEQELEHTEVARWAGESPGRPSRGYQLAKSSSRHGPPRRSLTHIAVVPPELLARAICTVREGTCSPERGWSDNGHLDNCIGP